MPGSVELGSEELELHPADGHTSDGMAVMARWCGLLCVGDYLSNVEIPMIESGLGDYRATLGAARAARGGGGDGRARRTARRARRDEALRILDEDVDYLDALERGEEKPRLCRRAATRASSGRSTRRIWRAFNPGWARGAGKQVAAQDSDRARRAPRRRSGRGLRGA